MVFDYFIVLAFGLAGALGGVYTGRRAARRAAPGDAQRIGPGRAADPRLAGWSVLAVAVAGGLTLSFPWALALRELLREEGVGQARHLGTAAVLGGSLFLALLGLGIAHAWIAQGLGPLVDRPPGGDAEDRSG